MLVELTIENFKAIHESTTVNFTAGTATRLSGNVLRHRNGERFVKSMAFYGPNASGKTTILDALYALKEFVDFSSRDQNPTSRIPRFTPFALDRESSKQPTRFALTIDLEGERFAFTVSALANRVWNESLSVQNITKQPSRKTPGKFLIERTWNPVAKQYIAKLHEDIGPELTRNAVIEQTTPNRLMLGKLASMNSDIARRVIEWFDGDLKFYDMHRNPAAEETKLTESAQLLKDNEEFTLMIERLMRDADTGILKLRITEEKAVEFHFHEEDNRIEQKVTMRPGISFRHATKDGSEVFFRRQQESSGTLRFVALLTAILQPGPRRRVICVDEISASLHPELVRRLIRVVHSSEYNPRGNQLLFTTHDTHLMDPGELLRRDQIILCTKDRFGRTSTKRLDEFQDFARSDANLQKQYLQGRFGSIPQFGPTLEDVPIDDEPLEIGN